MQESYSTEKVMDNLDGKLRLFHVKCCFKSTKWKHLKPG